MIWLASYPRSGNTFFRNILYEVYKIESSEYHKEKFELAENYASFPVVKTHLLPEQLTPHNPKIPAVYILRDGRDALVSMAHYRKNFIDPDSDFNFNLREAIIAAEGSYFGGWAKNVKKWLARAEIVIRYEDLINDPLKQVERLQAVLNLPKPDREKLPSFNSLKFGDPKYGTAYEVKKEGIEDFVKMNFRKGKHGSWKTDMPDELHDLFWNYHGEMMEKCGYSFEGKLTPLHPELDHLLIKKLGHVPANEEKKKTLLIESTKLGMPGRDGIKRYLIELLKAISPLTKNPDSNWKIDLSIHGEIIPLNEYLHKLDDEKGDKFFILDKLAVEIKSRLHKWIPEKFYQTLAPVYRKSFIRKVLAKQRYVKPVNKEYDLIHLPLPQNYEFFKDNPSPIIATVHDMSHRFFPDYHTELNKQLAEEGLQFLKARKAEVIAISEATANDTNEYYKITKSRISLIYEAADAEKFKINFIPWMADFVRKKYNLGQNKFLLCLSTIEPRKNLLNTIRAFNLLLEKHPQLQLNLVIAGNPGWKMDDLLKDKQIRSIKNIIFTGYVKDSHLAILYSEALSLCYVSHYEGFGLPPVEAMRCGTPVIYGNNSSMPEVIADGGLATDPEKILSIKEQMERMYFDEELYDYISQQAIKRAHEYSWRITAIEHLKIFEKVSKKN